jgi:ABC-type transport system substrate-binding protein
MNRALSILTILLALGLVLIGCGPGNVSQQENAGKKNVFRYPIVTNPTTLDPALVEDGDTIDLIQQVFEGLVGWDTHNQVVPVLAEKWEISSDGKTYTFHLKHGVKFHNGRELEAADFKYSIERCCDPATKSSTASEYLDDIVGTADMLAGKTKSLPSIRVLDKYTLQITIYKPRRYFLAKLTYPTAYVVAKEAAGQGPITSISQMVGTGPFKIASFDPNQLVTLTANPDYHDGKVAIDGIERPVVVDAATRLSMFKGGAVDLTPVAPEDLPGILADPTLKPQIKYYDRPGIYYIGFNVKSYKPFNDKRVRQAFAMAIDREKICSQILNGVDKIANTILPPEVFGHQDIPYRFPFDTTKAKALLAAAGYPDGKGLPPLEFDYRTGQTNVRLVAESIIGQLETNLGVHVEPREEEWTAYLAEHDQFKHPMFHMRWMADYLDPQDFLSLMLTTNGAENKTYYSNPQVDALCAAADQIQDQPKAAKLYNQAEDLILDDVAWIPVYYETDAELVSPRVKGMRDSCFGHLPHKAVSLD